MDADIFNHEISRKDSKENKTTDNTDGRGYCLTTKYTRKFTKYACCMPSFFYLVVWRIFHIFANQPFAHLS